MTYKNSPRVIKNLQPAGVTSVQRGVRKEIERAGLRDLSPLPPSDGRAWKGSRQRSALPAVRPGLPGFEVFRRGLAAARSINGRDAGPDAAADAAGGVRDQLDSARPCDVGAGESLSPDNRVTSRQNPRFGVGFACAPAIAAGTAEGITVGAPA